MRVMIDADACPVTDYAVRTARRYGVQSVLFCDDAHCISREDAQVITVLRGADSADFALVNRCGRGDIVVTQDYALAAMCIAKGAEALHPNGMRYTDENVLGLLSMRAAAQKARRAGQRVKGPRARTREMDEAFLRSLIELLEKGTLPKEETGAKEE